MINKVVLVSSVQQSDSVIHIHVLILFQIFFPFRLLQNTEQSSKKIVCYLLKTVLIPLIQGPSLLEHPGKMRLLALGTPSKWEPPAQRGPHQTSRTPGETQLPTAGPLLAPQ